MGFGAVVAPDGAPTIGGGVATGTGLSEVSTNVGVGLGLVVVGPDDGSSMGNFTTGAKVSKSDGHEAGSHCQVRPLQMQRVAGYKVVPHNWSSK